MPLIECPECLAQISDAASACPVCGHPFEPLPSQPKPRGVPWQPPQTIQPPTVYVKDTVMNRNRGCADLFLILLVISVAAIVGGCVFLGSR